MLLFFCSARGPFIALHSTVLNCIVCFLLSLFIHSFIHSTSSRCIFQQANTSTSRPCACHNHTHFIYSTCRHDYVLKYVSSLLFEAVILIVIIFLCLRHMIIIFRFIHFVKIKVLDFLKYQLFQFFNKLLETRSFISVLSPTVQHHGVTALGEEMCSLKYWHNHKLFSFLSGELFKHSNDISALILL